MWLIDGARSVGVAAGGSSADAMASRTGVAHIGMHGLEGCCGPHSEWRVASVAVLQDSPSRRDGLSLAHEQQRRLAALVLVRTLGRLLFKDSYVAIATAMVFFHRFYTRQSMTRHAPMVRQCAAFAGAAHWGAVGLTCSCTAQVTAMACLLLAGKVEESTKKMKDFMHYARIVPGLQSSLATKEVRGVQACGATCVCGVTLMCCATSSPGHSANANTDPARGAYCLELARV